MHAHLGKRGGAAVEVERARVLAQRAQHAGVRRGRQHHHRLLLPAAPQPLVRPLAAVHKAAHVAECLAPCEWTVQEESCPCFKGVYA